jgi:hypothetical protein
MPQNHAGYLDLDGRIARFDVARCCFNEGQLDVEAEGVNGGGKVQRRAVADGRPKSVAPLV